MGFVFFESRLSFVRTAVPDQKKRGVYVPYMFSVVAGEERT